MAELTCQHQGWIYNTALDMTHDLLAAEDVTQEVLLILLTKLFTFRGESSFRCWLHRIIMNHVINMKRRMSRITYVSFTPNEHMTSSAFRMEPLDHNTQPVDQPLISGEAWSFCMMGLFLCLDPDQRFIFVFGEMLCVGDRVGSQLFGVSKTNFRKKLSRARRRVYGFIREKYSEDKGCGSTRVKSIVNENNPFEKRYQLLHAFCQSQLGNPPQEKSHDRFSIYQEMLKSRELQDILNAN